MTHLHIESSGCIYAQSDVYDRGGNRQITDVRAWRVRANANMCTWNAASGNEATPVNGFSGSETACRAQ